MNLLYGNPHVSDKVLSITAKSADFHQELPPLC